MKKQIEYARPLGNIKMKIMKYILLLLTAISITSCGINKKDVDNEESNKFKVEYNGALKNMMHKGDVSAKADLKDFETSEHFYALGALENLKGEIQVFNSKPFNTMVVDSTLTFDNSFNKKATLLVYASVRKWKSINIPDNIVTYEQLEGYIEQTAKENKIQIDEPFPFLIEGKPESFDWHVINWKDGDTEHSHEKHISSGLNGTIENRQVEMLGFYSDSHHAIFTHHTTNMHIHVKTVDNKIAGHVDGLILGQVMTLKLPDTK
jgi:acetolactate decarboxylase